MVKFKSGLEELLEKLDECSSNTHIDTTDELIQEFFEEEYKEPEQQKYNEPNEESQEEESDDIKYRK